ncbi:hypothetical protein JCM8202v2_004415 [Rhodotorula sphaerocarpa]
MATQQDRNESADARGVPRPRPAWLKAAPREGRQDWQMPATSAAMAVATTDSAWRAITTTEPPPHKRSAIYATRESPRAANGGAPRRWLPNGFSLPLVEAFALGEEHGRPRTSAPKPSSGPRPFLPRHVSPSGVKLDPRWEGFKVSSLYFGTLDERGFGSFTVERTVPIKQGLMEFASMAGRETVKSGTVTVGGVGFVPAHAVQILFPPGFLSSLYHAPAPREPGEDPDVEPFYLVIGSRWTPRFFAYISKHPAGRVTSNVRVSALDAQHARQVPYLSRHLLLRVEFARAGSFRPTYARAAATHKTFEDLETECARNNLPKPQRLERLSVVEEQRHSRAALDRLSLAFRPLSPAHSYQLEGILRDGTLTPSELSQLVQAHVKVWNVTAGVDSDPAVEAILIELRTLLVEDRNSRAELLRLGVKSARELQGMQYSVQDMADRARQAVAERAQVQLHAPRRLGGSEADNIDSQEHFWCRGIIITPSGSVKVIGRTLEKSNATIRRYHHGVENHREYDHFLRVAFREEDEQALSTVSGGETGIAQKRLLDASVTRALKRGIWFGGRKYDFLAYSQSGLRDRNVWFVAPWTETGRDGQARTVTAETIRQQLGLFDEISRMPAKLGARFSQGFTSSIATVHLHHTKIASTPDIALHDKKGKELTNHTDGAGTMSPQLRDEVWKALLANGFRRDQDGPPPSVYQIRLGGSKGVIVLDDRLEGLQVQLRPSQDKFRGFADRTGAGEHFCLNISDAFTRPAPLRLNRPLISALDDLGIETEAFLAHQKRAIDALSTDALFTLRGADRILNQLSLGGASRFKSLMKSLAELPGFDDRILQEEPFLRAALEVVRVRGLRDLKHRARIPLPDSYVLVGVPDTDGLLEPEECYACLRFPERPNRVQYLSGRILVTRSPVMDPGDIRVLQAVGKVPPELDARFTSCANCLVLSTKGERSVTSMMGGGDLDGDTYQVITLPELIPAQVAPPRLHEAKPPFELDRPAVIEDVAECFVDYLCNDTVGQIANIHLCLADRSSQHGFDPECQKLADLHSLAVDAPKTGNLVPLRELPRPGRKVRPDFMRKSDVDDAYVPPEVEYYVSGRALGHLYRSIDDDDVATPGGVQERQADDGTSASLERLHVILKRDLSSVLGAPPEALSDVVARHKATVEPLISAFLAALENIAITHTPARHDGRKLSEVELYAVASLLGVHRGEAARGNSVAATFQHVAAVVEWLETELSTPDRADFGKLELRYAAWRIASRPDENAEEEGCRFGRKTARWLCLSLLLEGLAAEEQRREDLISGITRVEPAKPTTKLLHVVGKTAADLSSASVEPPAESAATIAPDIPWATRPATSSTTSTPDSAASEDWSTADAAETTSATSLEAFEDSTPAKVYTSGGNEISAGAAAAAAAADGSDSDVNADFAGIRRSPPVRSSRVATTRQRRRG